MPKLLVVLALFPRMLQPSEIALLRQSKQEIACKVAGK